MCPERRAREAGRAVKKERKRRWREKMSEVAVCMAGGRRETDRERWREFAARDKP